MASGKKNLQRCQWCGADTLNISYHDDEWGVPVFDERTLFEFLILEGAQAGLSWTTVLKKRDGYRKAFHDYDIERVATMDAAEQQRLMKFNGIVRNRLKISSAVGNAKAFLEVQRSEGSFCSYLWGFVEGRPIINTWKSLSEIPAETELSTRISKALKKRGFRFVGPTIIYAYMQAIGMVNDHEIGCFRHAAISANNATSPCG